MIYVMYLLGLRSTRWNVHSRHWSIQANLTGRRPLEWIIAWIYAGQCTAFSFFFFLIFPSQPGELGWTILQDFVASDHSFGPFQPVSPQWLRMYVWEPVHIFSGRRPHPPSLNKMGYLL